MEWKNIADRPKEDGAPHYFVLCPGNDAAPFIIHQVSNFQGMIFPDALDFNVDEMDAITNASHWSEIGSLPR